MKIPSVDEDNDQQPDPKTFQQAQTLTRLVSSRSSSEKCGFWKLVTLGFSCLIDPHCILKTWKLHLKRCLQHVHTHPYDSFRSLPLTYPFNDRHRRTASIKSLIQIPIAHNPQIPNHYSCTIAAENAIPNTLIKFQTLSGKSAMRPSQKLDVYTTSQV